MRTAAAVVQSQYQLEWRAKTNKNFPIKSQHLYSPHDPKWICIFDSWKNVRFIDPKRMTVRQCAQRAYTKSACIDMKLHGNVLHFIYDRNLFMRMHTCTPHTRTVIISWYYKLCFKTRAPALSHRSL